MGLHNGLTLGIQNSVNKTAIYILISDTNNAKLNKNHV